MWCLRLCVFPFWDCCLHARSLSPHWKVAPWDNPTATQQVGLCHSFTSTLCSRPLSFHYVLFTLVFPTATPISAFSTLTILCCHPDALAGSQVNSGIARTQLDMATWSDCILSGSLICTMPKGPPLRSSF